MNIVDITDIEDLILCKHEIDKALIENKELEEKMSLSEFMTKYVNLNNTVYVFKRTIIGFSYINIYGKSFLLIQGKNQEYIDILLKFLKNISYDFSNLKKVSNVDIISNIEEKPFIILDGIYYSF